ncbi:polysaccharide deacetylase [Opitutaceae bacterium TAV5]|nr:polysaccharide deacetylase [Opitutaceae bacterium TAV5]
MKTTLSLLLLSTLLAAPGILPVTLHAAGPAPANILENGGFEEGDLGWRFVSPPDTTATVNESAARTGKSGFSITDNSATAFPRAMSRDFPTAPGHRYKVAFWARTHSPGTYGGITVRFLDSAGKMVGDPGVAHAQVSNTGDQWQPFELTVAAPAGVATIALWLHTYARQEGVIDFDDIELVDLGGADGDTAPPLPAPAPVAAGSDGARGLYVVIKADDLRAIPRGVHPRWAKFVSFLRERGIKSGIGIIAQSFEADNPAYFSWIKECQASGLVEFWYHGHDHRQWKDNGADVYEFKGSGYEHQRDHLALSQRLARERLGFAFSTFGAPFNVTDEATSRVLAEDSDITVWLYGDKTAPAGKVILDRDWGVGIENPLFVPNPEKFAAGYAATSASRRYYVIQGHPAQWDDARFENFVRIIDFLVAHEARFVTPSELARVPGI